MAFNLGGGTKAKQTQNQLQVAAASGPAYGGAVGKGAVAAGSMGNVTGGIKTGAGGSVNLSFVDPGAFHLAESALNSNAITSMAALQANQELSTLAVGYANQNAN